MVAKAAFNHALTWANKFTSQYLSPSIPRSFTLEPSPRIQEVPH